MFTYFGYEYVHYEVCNQIVNEFASLLLINLTILGPVHIYTYFVHM